MFQRLLLLAIVSALVPIASPVRAARAPALWVRDGVSLGSTPSFLFLPLHIVPDSSGGAIVSWDGVRCDEPCGFPAGVFAQRVTHEGALVAGWNVRGLKAASAAEIVGTDVAPGPGGGAFIVSTLGGVPNPGYSIQQVIFVGGDASVTPPATINLVPSHSAEARIASDGAGGVIAAWPSDYGSGGAFAVTVQRVSAEGAITWPAGGIELSARTFSVNQPVIVGDGAGGAIVAWSDAGVVRAQRVDAAGNALWSFGGNAIANALADELAIVSDDAHGAIVAWHDTRADGGDIYAMRVGAGGAPMWTGGGAPVCVTTSTQTRPALARDAAGGVLVTWNDSNGKVYVARLDSTGAPVTGWDANGVIACAGSTNRGDPAITRDDLGGAYVAWTDGRNGKADTDLYAQHVTGNGTLASGWDPNGNEVCVRPNRQENPVMTGDGAGGAIVAWQDSRDLETSIDPLVYAQRIAADGVVPVQITAVRSEARDGSVRIEWYAAALDDPAPVVERDHGGWRAVGFARGRGTGIYEFEDHDVLPASRYGYRLAYTANGERRTAGEIEVDTPGRGVLAIEPVWPNPARGAFRVSFALADAAPARLEVVDLAGRRVETRALSATSGAGRVVLGGDRPLPAGVYLVRIVQGGRVATARAVVLR